MHTENGVVCFIGVDAEQTLCLVVEREHGVVVKALVPAAPQAAQVQHASEVLALLQAKPTNI